MSLYSEKLSQLKSEMSEEVKNIRKKYTLKPYQEAVYNFVIGKRNIIQFEVASKQYFVKTGDENSGFKHIINKHYGKDCTGCITVKDILNMENIIKFGRELTDVELNKHGNYGYEQIKDTKRFRLICKKDINGNFIISLFSNEDANELGDCF